MANNLFADIGQQELNQLLDAGAQLAGEGTTVRLEVPGDRLLEVMSLLRGSKAFAVDYLADVTAVDRGDAGFEVVYQLFSIKNNARGAVKTLVNRDNPQVATVTSLWPGADWMEREVFDLMGVEFEGHPCLKRILLNEEFVGHPLRKDFRMQPPE